MARALTQRVLNGGLQGSPSEHVFHIGFTACNDYAQGFEAFSDVESSKLAILFILGKYDQMTTSKAAQGLISAAPRAKVVTVDAGHQLMSEAPDATLAALFTFLQKN
jgi:pimeloyl-ACP methyl ester carboxylesterase